MIINSTYLGLMCGCCSNFQPILHSASHLVKACKKYVCNFTFLLLGGSTNTHQENELQSKVNLHIYYQGVDIQRAHFLCVTIYNYLRRNYLLLMNQLEVYLIFFSGYINNNRQKKITISKTLRYHF